MQTKLGKKTWLSIVIFSLVGQIAWTMENMFFNVFIVNQFQAETWQVALMVSSSALIATLATLLTGALSDKVGKRKIFIVIGYIIWGLIILSFAFVNNETVKNAGLGIGLVILLDCLMTFFGSGANDACFNAYLTDISDSSNRGKIEGINSAMPLVSILIVFGLFSGYTTGSGSSWNIIFYIISGCVLFCGVLGLFTIKDPKLETNSNESYFGNIIHGFKPSVIKDNKILYIVLLAFTIFGISLQVYMPYYILYLQRADITASIADAIGMEPYVIVMAPAIIIASVFTILYGRIIDKHNYKSTLPPVLIIYIIGLLILTFASKTLGIFIGCMLMMCGYLASTAVFNAMIRKHTPKNKAGLFQGIRIVCSVLIPMLIGPWIGSLICGGGASFGVVGDDFKVTSLIFLGGLIVGLFIIVPILFVKKEDMSNELIPETNKEISENE